MEMYLSKFQNIFVKWKCILSKFQNIFVKWKCICPDQTATSMAQYWLLHCGVVLSKVFIKHCQKHNGPRVLTPF